MLLRSLPMKIKKRLFHDVINTFVTRADLVRDVPYTEDNRHKMAALTAVFSRLRKFRFISLINYKLDHKLHNSTEILL